MSDESALTVVRTVKELRAEVKAWHAKDLKVGLVPTMGALHDGHLSLVRQLQGPCDRVVATLFVNPKQFGPKEDLGTYPRDEEGDKRKLLEAGCDLLFAPDPAEMYPEGHATTVAVSGLGDLLEGEYRPGFFNGVATVVSKLLLQAQADVAIFGEKDYQQLQVIKRMVADLNIPVTIRGGKTIREPDGLAMSSRNAYLTPAERAAAPTLHATLQAVAERARAGEPVETLEAWAADQLLKAGFREVNYVTIRDAATLGDWAPEREGRVLAAAWLGKARLIDNLAV